MHPEPITPKKLEQLLTKIPKPLHAELNYRVQEYNGALFQFNELKRDLEWMKVIAPDIFEKAEKKLRAAGADIKSGHLFDTKWKDWNKHMEQFDDAVKKLQEEQVDDHIKEKFKSYFEKPEQKQKAEDFITSYNAKITALHQEIAIWRKEYGLDESIMEAELEKQLKIVQAHIIQALKAGSSAEKSKRLGLAKEALAGIGLALAGAGLGMTVAAAMGSVVPVWGTATAGVLGGVAGGLYGGIRAYRNYETAKADLQNRLDKVLGKISEYPKLLNATHMNRGIAQLKSPETFDWFVGGPRSADYEKVGTTPNRSEDAVLHSMLESKFAESRGAYFHMLQDMIRGSAADAAIQVAAGLNPAPPFDACSAILISTQFSIMCTAQIGTARAMGNLPELEDFPAGHVPVKTNKESLHDAAAGLAANAECLISLAHQINLCTNINHRARAELLNDIHTSLTQTISTYNALVDKNELPLQKDLAKALKNGMAMDIKNKGLKIKVDDEEVTASMQKQSKLEKKTYEASASTLKFLKHEPMQHPSAVYHHQKAFDEEDRPYLEKALIGADYFMNAVAGPSLGIYGVVSTAFSPFVMNPEDPESVEFAHSGTTVDGLAAGLTLGVLALACGVGSAVCGAKADHEREKLCILGDVAERRHLIHYKLNHQEQGSAALVQRTDDELRVLLENPDLHIKLKQTQHHGLAAQSNEAKTTRELAATERTSSLNTVGMWRRKGHDALRAIPPGRKADTLKVMNGGLKCLSELPDKVQKEMDRFQKNPNHTSGTHQQNIHNLYEEANIFIFSMKRIINTFKGLPEGTSPGFMRDLDKALDQLKQVEEGIENYELDECEEGLDVEWWKEVREGETVTVPKIEEYKIKEMREDIEAFKNSIPVRGPRDVRGEEIDRLEVKKSI